MGSLLKAVCDCGFESDYIYAGGGISNYRTVCLAPALCSHCKTFIITNYLNSDTLCPACRRHVTFYNHSTLQKPPNESDHEPIFSWHVDGKDDFVLYDTAYVCPTCGETRLTFIKIGHWD